MSQTPPTPTPARRRRLRLRRRLNQHFAQGDRVLVINTSMSGKVVRKGEQQSEVRLDIGRTQYFPNHWLVRVRES